MGSANRWEFQAAFGDFGHIIKIETPLNGTAAPRKQHPEIRYIIFIYISLLNQRRICQTERGVIR